MANYLVLLVCLSFLFPPLLAKAGTKILIKEKECTYRASEHDSEYKSSILAMNKCQELLLEEIGIYLESETEVKNFQLSKEQIKTFAAGVVRAERIDYRWDGKSYWLKARIEADPKEVFNSIDKLRNDRQKTRELEEARRTANDLVKELERVRKELELAKTDRTKLSQYDEAINRLSATDWYLRGVSLIRERKYEDGIAANTRAIQLNPQYEFAYVNRSFAYSSLGYFQQGLEDATRAIELNPKLAFAFVNRSLANSNLGNWGKVLEDANKAIELDPINAWAYANRSHAYYILGNHRQAFEDANKAIELDPKLAGAYANRGEAYWVLGNIERAIADYKTAAGLGHKKAQEVLDNLEKQQGYHIASKAACENCLRIFRPGDYINYKLIGFVNTVGGDLPLLGTAQYRITDETQVDYYGNQCKIFRMTMEFTVVEKDRSVKVKRTVDQYITQDENGSLMIHGTRDSAKGLGSFVKTPSSGWYYEFKCPFYLHESVSQNVVFTDGSSINGTDMILNQERVSVPAGVFTAVKAISNSFTTNADSSKRQNIETTWLAPEIGPIRLNSESSSDKHSMKIILEMTDTNIPYKK